MDIKLIMFKPDGQRKDIPVSSLSTVIGRGEDCGLRIPLLAVSRRHCELSFSEAGLRVKDLASSNGTYVNNNRINETDVNAGDRLVIGPVVFTVQIDGMPDEITPVKTRGQRMVETGEGRGVVELEPEDATGNLGTLESTQDEEEMDPIAALEALAAESDKNLN